MGGPPSNPRIPLTGLDFPRILATLRVPKYGQHQRRVSIEVSGERFGSPYEIGGGELSALAARVSFQSQTAQA